jgi:hypothetical protein
MSSTDEVSTVEASPVERVDLGAPQASDKSPDTQAWRSKVGKEKTQVEVKDAQGQITKVEKTLSQVTEATNAKGEVIGWYLTYE